MNSGRTRCQCGAKSWLISLQLVAFVSRCAASSVAITNTRPPNGIIKTYYSAVMRAVGGCTPDMWAIASGALPSGVTAKASRSTTSLNLAGTPTTAARYSFVVRVSECGGHVSQASYKVVIQATAKHVVHLSWQASTSSDVVGYNVYRRPDGVPWHKINPDLIASTLYNDSTVANDSTYYYAATAVDIQGRESRRSGEVTVVIPWPATRNRHCKF